MHRRRSVGRRSLLRFSTAGLAALGLSACAAQSAGTSDDGLRGESGEGTVGYPVTVGDCGTTLRFDAAPDRLVLLETAPVTILEGLGVLERAVAKAGVFPAAYYAGDQHGDLAARVAAIPSLSDDIDGGGHLQINQEVVIAQRPDLVLGMPDGVTREGLATVGAQVLVQNVYCTSVGPATWEDLDAEIRLYGEILDRTGAAEDLISAISSRLAAVQESARARTRGSAAVLYPTIGGGPMYTYGAASMATPQLDAVGLDNVFASTPERVFEVSAEALIDADPDRVVVLYQGDDDGAGAVAELRTNAATRSLRAVTEGSVRAQLFNFSEPSSPLVVDGAEQLDAWLSGGAR